MRKFMKSKKGFTLVELLIVVVILGILAAVAIPRFVTTKAESQKQACRSNLSAMQAKIEENLFTHVPAILATDVNGDIDAAVGLADSGIIPANFPNGIPKCPSGGNYTIVDGVVSCSNSTDALGGHRLDSTVGGT